MKYQQQRTADVARRLDLLIADARRFRAEEDARITADVVARRNAATIAYKQRVNAAIDAARAR